MHARTYLLLGIAVLLMHRHADAQQTGESFSNIRQKTVAIGADTIRLDSMAIVGNSVVIDDVPSADYLVMPYRAQLLWLKKPERDSVSIKYRVLPLAANYAAQHKSTALIDSNILFRLTPVTETAKEEGFGEAGKLDYNGSYGRSITVGNNQDVVLNSAFNLQASGYILDSIKLEAALTDNTIPFQPEGNTQRLQEFDQIFIRLQKKKHSLQIGDYNLDTPPGYFLKYFKRVQGLYYQYGAEQQGGLGSPPQAIGPGQHGFSSFPYGNDSGRYSLKGGKQQKLAVSNSFGLSASMAKGQFVRNIFQGSEGNQGPYKLTGNNGEQYFIVLAATERVYVDNIRMERGESADYTINYNTAEIRFMPRRMITKDSRIQVEFEYVDRNYLNSLIYAWDEVKLGKKWDLRVQAYSNQDAKNQPYLQNLNGEQKRFLASVGDSTQYAFFPNIATDTFSANKILYRLDDTVVNGVLYDSVFIYSTNPEEARFVPSFAYVGEGRGNYILSDKAANGRVYDWVAPVNGAMQGGFAPVQLLIAPKKQQVFQLISNYHIDSLKNLNIELAGSNNDPNLFATNNGSHWGSAVKLRYDEQRHFGRRDSLQRNAWAWQNTVSYEYVQNRFKTVAPYRSVEFGRDWNVPQLGDKPDEHLADLATSLSHRIAGTASYKFSNYRRGSEYEGYRHIIGYDLMKDKTKVGFTANILNAADTLQNIRFLRPSVFAEQVISPLKMLAGARWSTEHNMIKSKSADTLTPTAFSFDITTLYLKSLPSNFEYGLTYFTRADRSPIHNEFLLQNRSHNLELKTNVAQWHDQSFTFTGTYRKLVVSDTSVLRVRPEETGLGRLEWNGTALKQVFTGNAIYEGGSGQEQKRSYTFVEVPAGQGVYTWNDYNSDGIQGANEFEIALYPDQRRYIRVLTPTNDYVKVNYVNLSLSLGIEPGYYWKAKDSLSRIKKFIGKLSTLSSLQIANRLLGSEGVSAYNPFLQVLNNDAIISTSNAISQSIYYNRNSAVWGIDYNLLYTAGKQLLTYGVEGSDSRQHLYKLRWSLTPSLMLNASAKHGARTYQSALNDNRSYDLKLYSVEPSISLLYRSVWRTTALVRYEERKNLPVYGGEKAEIKSIDLDTRISKPATGVIALGITYTQIGYNGIAGKPVTFTILDALQPGANYLWRANWERRVGKGIEVQLQYEGRKPGGKDVIHTGTMSVRAIL
jgi:hypothetical protein